MLMCMQIIKVHVDYVNKMHLLSRKLTGGNGQWQVGISELLQNK